MSQRVMQMEVDILYNVLFYFTVKFTKFEFGIFGTARIACGAGSMKRYGDRPSVCLSVCPIRPPHAAAAGLLLWAWRAGYQPTATAAAGDMRAVPCCQRT